MSEAEKQRSHRRILDAAGQMVRERGIEATSVSDVMSAAGMTHGGFYRHFASKDELVAAAFRHAVDGIVADMEGAETPEGLSRERDAYIATYLSPSHVENRAKGCPLAAIGAELARADGAPGVEASEAAKRMADLLQIAPGEGAEQGFASMALLMGTVTLARLAKTEDDAAIALEAGKKGLEILQAQWNKA